MKRKFGRVKFKTAIFIMTTIITFLWIIIYGFVHQPYVSLTLYFTFQSNFILWIYYLLWMIAYLNFRYFDRRNFLRVMDNYRWNVFTGSIISLTSFVAIFLFGPFYPTYLLIHHGFNHKIFSSNKVVLYDLFHLWNLFALHVLIPWIVIYDLWTDNYDEDKIEKSAYLIGAAYFFAYLIFVEINGGITHNYPYPVLNVNAFDNETIGWFFALVSPIVGIIIYLFGDHLWYRNVISRNGGSLFNERQ